ncbi:type II toxin-antitoxin system RelB family antitoxin [Actinotignum urinale]|uniref:type II toxin-antitoxin system RelB family antitoxin n=1 Tax=Actinotignum urinale TaxID=190146 RepID=UPI00280B2C31|nr:ribbon-helix-helix protein, CopG family [Actinotignum urinale]
MARTITKPTAIRLPAELVERYDALARETGRSRTYYVTQALTESITQLEYEYGLLQRVEDYRAGRMQTVTLEDMEKKLALDD